MDYKVYYLLTYAGKVKWNEGDKGQGARMRHIGDDSQYLFCCYHDGWKMPKAQLREMMQATEAYLKHHSDMTSRTMKELRWFIVERHDR